MQQLGHVLMASLVISQTGSPPVLFGHDSLVLGVGVLLAAFAGFLSALRSIVKSWEVADDPLRDDTPAQQVVRVLIITGVAALFGYAAGALLVPESWRHEARWAMMGLAGFYYDAMDVVYRQVVMRFGRQNGKG